MKRSPMTEGSGSSTDSKTLMLHLTGSGVRKSSSRRKKPKTFVQTTEEESPQEKEKWQAFFDSARDESADIETVRALLATALEEERTKKEVREKSHTDFSEYPDYDVNGLMAQIYQDLHNVAAAQASKTGSEKASTGRVFMREVGDIDGLLQKVSAGVSSAISKFSATPTALQLLIHLQNQHMPIFKLPNGRSPARLRIATKIQLNAFQASIQPTSGTPSWPLITAGSFSANWLTPPLSARQLATSTHPNGKPPPPPSMKTS